MPSELKTSAKVKSNSFIERKRPIDALRRRLHKCHSGAVDMLENLMDHPETPVKEKIETAKLLLKFYVDILNSDSQDKIKRLEMQLKYNEELERMTLGGKTVEVIEQDDDDDFTPILNFNEIMSVD